MNIPNKLTLFRVIIAIGYFALLAFVPYFGEVESPDANGWSNFICKGTGWILLDIANVMFIVAAITDLLDGYLARKLDMVSDFGRIADPFADKILVCGSFIFLVSITNFVLAWMVVLLIGREFLVSGLRGFAEAKGMQFPSMFWGKVKMFVQCVAISCVLFYLAHLRFVPGATYFSLIVQILVWITIVTTVLSASDYLLKAKKVLRNELF